MTPRPIHRWKSLWLGILVLAFLGWSWVQSMNRLDTFRFRLGTDVWEIAGSKGSISAERYGDVITRNLHSIRFASGFRFGGQTPTAFDSYVIDESPERHGWMVAHWFIIILFLIPWSALLVWRHHRMKRQAAGTAAPPARSST